MDFRKFVMSLSDDDFATLSNAIDREKTHRAEEDRMKNGTYEPLNDEEKALIGKHWVVKAVKAYMERTGASLIEAKYLVDRHREWRE